MKVQKFLSATFLSTAILVGSAFSAKPKPTTSTPAQVVDKGSFSIFVNGKRVATEEFTISQTAQGSVAESSLKLQDGKPAQGCKLELTPDGHLQKYEWHVLGGQDKSAALVEPDNEFLIEHLTMPDLKTAEHRFLLNSTTSILDDYFFSQREILLWRYLAGNCKPVPGNAGCSLGQAQYGVITPRQQMSALVNFEYVGRENIEYKGAPTGVSHFKMTSENSEWHLWLDQDNKLVRISVPAEATEVVRD